MFLIDETFNGREITLSLGDEIHLELGETRTTGYHWSVESTNPEVCCLSKDSFVGAPSQPPGASGSHQFIFNAKQKGSAAITAKSIRAWEQKSPPARELIFHVVVE
jgi:predicted secreted protein